jgi:hypothetical protein
VRRDSVMHSGEEHIHMCIYVIGRRGVWRGRRIHIQIHTRGGEKCTSRGAVKVKGYIGSWEDQNG